MSAERAEDVVDAGVSLVQKMLSAVTGSVMTSLLGMCNLHSHPFFNHWDNKTMKFYSHVRLYSEVFSGAGKRTKNPQQHSTSNKTLI